jgi:hypothetical protein
MGVFDGIYFLPDPYMIGRWIWSPFFLEMLYSLRVRQGDMDRICWIPSKRCKFEVRSYFMCYPYLLRVVFFVWTMALKKILTLDNLRKRNIIVVDWCGMCKKSEESINLLLLHCEVV